MAIIAGLKYPILTRRCRRRVLAITFIQRDKVLDEIQWPVVAGQANEETSINDIS